MTVGEQAADRLTLRGIRGFGHHGVHDSERRDGQEFVVDVVLGLDTRDASSGDDLARTVHYGTVAERVKTAVEAGPVDLIETLAQRIADLCLTERLVRWVEVTVHKPDAPIGVTFEDVAVTIHRSRRD